jgi:hypothetical protein
MTRPILCGAALALILLAHSANGLAGHYVVIEIAAGGQPEPVFHAEVAMEARTWPVDHRAMGRPKAAAADHHLVHVRAFAGTRAVFAQVLALATVARSEGPAPEGTMLHDLVPLGRPAFALRLPAEADRLVIETAVGKTAFDLEALAARAGSLPLAKGAGDSRVVGKRLSGPPGNRLDLLVMGDGYVAGQEGIFNRLAEEIEDEYFSRSPMREYAGLVNVARLFTASPQMGADHPPYRAGCAGANCCADPAAQSDPLAPRFVDTAFDASFCMGGQIHRALGVNISKLLAAASAVPDWDVILVLVNDPVFGGLGYFPAPNGAFPGIAIGSATEEARSLMLHELGHSLMQLGDEYSIPGGAPGGLYCSDRGGAARCLDNHTDETDPERLKWRQWVEPGMPLPSPPGARGVGLFEGVLQHATGLYRPTFTACLMHTTSHRDLCPVCRESFVRTLYDGRFGQPAGGIDLIEPGSEWPSPERPVPVIEGRVVGFGAEVIAPALPGIERQWYLDGEPLPGADGDTLELAIGDGVTGRRTLELRVVDGGSFLRSDAARAVAVHSRSWLLDVLPAVEQDFALCGALSGAWFNPDTAGQGLFLDISEEARFAFAGWFTWDAVGGSHDWFTLQGGFQAGDTGLTLPLLQSAGGRFDAPDPVQTAPVGEVRIDFQGCTRASFQYQIDDGRSGVMLLERLLPEPEACTLACRFDPP